jgi:hypothetical protein
MADPKETVTMYHAEANPTEGVEVTRQDYETVWKEKGWKLQPVKKEGK